MCVNDNPTSVMLCHLCKFYLWYQLFFYNGSLSSKHTVKSLRQGTNIFHLDMLIYCEYANVLHCWIGSRQ